MDGLSSSLAVLTAMITPAVLISASGTMILSSSTRLGRVVDRTRSLSDRLQEVSAGDANAAIALLKQKLLTVPNVVANPAPDVEILDFGELLLAAFKDS